MTNIKQLETLAHAATSGEWVKRKWGWDDDAWPEKRISVSSSKGAAIVISPRYGNDQTERDMEYIAAANPNTVLQLCEIIRELREGLAMVQIVADTEPKDHAISDIAREALAKANDLGVTDE